jgi:hypothetical protein
MFGLFLPLVSPGGWLRELDCKIRLTNAQHEVHFEITIYGYNR